jgi:hypothetical protein
LRTGWNSHENKLTPAKVGSPEFTLLHSLTLDDEVDAQPLVVPDVKITGGSWPGKHDVVYVATEGDTIYAIDAKNGAVLLSPNFGLPVQMPQGCNNNGPNVGINGTPVIDLASNTMYVIIYTLEAGGPIIHALDLSSLTDKVAPREVKASHGAFTFHPEWQRQRPGLLLANGNVYAGFGSFCDWGGTNSRGWLLGWQAGSLAPLPANQLNDREATAPNPPHGHFLASIWMSGYGLAADAAGSLYFVTGNSDSNYNMPNSIQESVVKISPDLTTIGGSDYFTPWNESALDSADNDYGSGGALLLPDQTGSAPHLAAAAGKDGRMFLLNRDNLGGYNPPAGPDHVVGMVNIGGCWCGQSYFVGSDGVGRIASSGGSNVTVWKVQTSPSVTLVNESSSAAIGGAQDPGFFTSISSAGTAGAIIWAVSRPNDPLPANLTLYAFKADSGGATLPTLFHATAGAWPSFNGAPAATPISFRWWLTAGCTSRATNN